MPLRRKTRSTRTSETAKEVRPISPTSNGGRTHPKEMYAPDRATRSRTSSDELVILELPKSSRLKKPNNSATDKEDSKAKRLTSPTDRLNSNAAGSVKQTNDVNNSSPHNDGDALRTSGRTRRRSGRVSGDSSAEKEARKTSPHVVSSSRSERRRRRSSTDVETGSPTTTTPDSSKTVNKSGRLRRRSSTSSEDRSPVGRQDNSKQTKKNNSNSKRFDHPDDDDGNFKVPSEPVDVVTMQESPRAGRRQTMPGKSSSNMDKVLSVDVTSHDSLPTRTSPRRPKVSPRADRTNATAAGGKDTPRTKEGAVASSKDALISPRTRGGASTTSVLSNDGTEVKDASDSSRKRHPSDESHKSDTGVGAHSNRKRRRTGSVCRDLTSQFEVPNPEQAGGSKETSDTDEKADETDQSVSARNHGNDHNDNTDEVLTALNLQRLQDDGSVSPGSKTHRRGTTTPTNSPRKSRAKSPARSPSSRRGLRSAGNVPGAPPDTLDSCETEESKQEANEASDDAKSVDSSSVKGVLSTDMEEKIDAQQEGDGTTTSIAATEDGLMQDSDMVEIEDYEEFAGEGWYEDVEETELFYFESDHVALKGNRDYRMMLRTLSTLEAQRKQAVQDLDLLVDKKKESLQNPVLFAQKLQKRDDVGLPTPQKVVVLPEIEWEKYLGAAEAIEIAGFKHQTRGAKTNKKFSSNKPSSSNVVPSASSIQSAVQQLSQKVASTSSSSSSQLQSFMQHQPSTSAMAADTLLDSSDRREVRGRMPLDPNKPASFNQLWTVEEQRKLEELLVKYPMEEVEARRWEKVAKALGNRTSQQVASRVQKYFIKLTKAGLPVPGRIPNMTYYSHRKVLGMRTDKRMHPFTKSLYQPSTFLQSIRPPVYMQDDDENIGWSGYCGDNDDYGDDVDDCISDDETIPVELRASDEYQELLRLKKMKRDRLKHQSLMSHQGFKCDGCNMEPIVGIRWHCVDCPTDVSTDLCQGCVDCDFTSPHHPSSHQMDPIQYNYSGYSGDAISGGPSFVDTDYTRFTPSTGDYNYLDPNYNPSTMPT